MTFKHTYTLQERTSIENKEGIRTILTFYSSGYGYLEIGEWHGSLFDLCKDMKIGDVLPAEISFPEKSGEKSDDANN